MDRLGVVAFLLVRSVSTSLCVDGQTGVCLEGWRCKENQTIPAEVLAALFPDIQSFAVCIPNARPNLPEDGVDLSAASLPSLCNHSTLFEREIERRFLPQQQVDQFYSHTERGQSWNISPDFIRQDYLFTLTLRALLLEDVFETYNECISEQRFSRVEHIRQKALTPFHRISRFLCRNDNECEGRETCVGSASIDKMFTRLNLRNLKFLGYCKPFTVQDGSDSFCATRTARILKYLAYVEGMHDLIDPDQDVIFSLDKSMLQYARPHLRATLFVRAFEIQSTCISALA